MSLGKIINGTHKALQDRDDAIFKCIAEQYKLDVNSVRNTVYKELDNAKIKAMKPQARQPKRDNGVDKKTREKSGYHLYCGEIRKEAQRLLSEVPAERTFLDINKKTVVLEEESFKNGAPKFAHITKKCASMWWGLSEEERGSWIEKAKNYVEPAIPTKEEVVASEESEQVEEVIPAKKPLPPRKGEGRVKNNKQPQNNKNAKKTQ